MMKHEKRLRGSRKTAKATHGQSMRKQIRRIRIPLVSWTCSGTSGSGPKASTRWVAFPGCCGAARSVAMDGALRRRIAFTMILRLRSSITGFALPGLGKENLELLPLSASSMGLRARAFLDRYSRTASEDRATTLGQYPPVALASEPVRFFIAIRARPRRTVVQSILNRKTNFFHLASKITKRGRFLKVYDSSASLK